jgi:streptogramin lyase
MVRIWGRRKRRVRTAGRKTTARAHRSSICPGLEQLEDRCVPSVTFQQFGGFHQAGVSPSDIAPGPDGNLWFLSYNGNGNVIGRITPTGAITEFPLPDGSPRFSGLSAGPDGRMWFTDPGGRIWRMSLDGTFTSFVVHGTPDKITAGPDGNLWFTTGPNLIGRITPDGAVTEFDVPMGGPGAYGTGITAGPDGNLWFTVYGVTGQSEVGKITPDGAATLYHLPQNDNAPESPVTAGDGSIWFTENSGSRIGRVTPRGVITEFDLPGPGASLLFSVAVGGDGNLWFPELQAGAIGRLTPSGMLTIFPVPESSAGPLDITADAAGNLWFTDVVQNHVWKLVPDPEAASSGTPVKMTIGVLGGVSGANAVFVNTVYEQLLGRSADPGGLNAWVNWLSSGASRAQIVAGIEASREYLTRVVDNLYATLLGRPAEPAGEAGFVAGLANGMTLESVKAIFLGSPEYFQKHGSDNAAFLQALYHAALGRPIDPAGQSFWSNALTHLDRSAVAAFILTSPESQQHLIESAYQQYLDRPADPVGLANALVSVQRGMVDQTLIAEIIGSVEFFRGTSSL